MSSKTYDFMKKVALIYIPALEAFWLTIGQIWGFPYVTQIGATIAAVGVFIGAIIGISNANYKKALSEDEPQFSEVKVVEEGE